MLGPEWWGKEVGIRGAEGTGGGVEADQVSEVGGGLVMEGFVGEEKDFELDALRDREPVEFLKDGGDMVAGAGVGEEACSRILNIL